MWVLAVGVACRPEVGVFSVLASALGSGAFSPMEVCVASVPEVGVVFRVEQGVACGPEEGVVSVLGGEVGVVSGVCIAAIRSWHMSSWPSTLATSRAVTSFW